MNFLKLKEADIEGKKVLIRVDYNIPIKDGKVTDDTRIQRTLPTINYLLENNCKIILMSHLGRPHKDMKKGASFDEVKIKYTVKPVAERLKEILSTDVAVAKDYPEKDIPDEKVVLLENLRFYEGELKNDDTFAKRLSSFAEFYVNDAFGTCHREHASVHAVTKFLPSAAGFLVENEIEKLSKLLSPDKPFVAIIGGAKADKIGVIKSLLPKVDNMIIGGVLANTFMKAKGIDIKGSKYDDETLKVAKELISDNKIILPEDVIAAEKFEEGSNLKNVDVVDIPDSWMAVDIGKKTIDNYKEILRQAKTVVWGGPLGVFEIDSFSNGTRKIADFISKLDAVTIIGGGDSAAAVNKLGYAGRMTHVSTGGGASLDFIRLGGKLPAIIALEEAKSRQ